MFSGCSLLNTLNLGNYNTSNVVNMKAMFERSSLLRSINLNSFNTKKVTNMDYMFSSCFSLDKLDLNNFDFSSMISMAYMFSSCKSLSSIKMPSFTDSSVINLSHMFSDCSNLLSLDVTTLDTSNVLYMAHMFANCKFLEYLNIITFNTSSVKDMKFMFLGCSYLKCLNLSNFDTKSVEQMNGMFYGCDSLKILNLSNFNTESTKNMAFMFYNTKSIITLDISNFNTTNVEYMYFMFNGCKSLFSLDISNFDTSKIKSMEGMFTDCSDLQIINISNFNTKSVISMKNMFSGCKSLNDIDLSSFDSSLVTVFDHMFSGCFSLKNLNIEYLNTSSAVSMKYLFANCSSITYINLEKFITNNVIDMTRMFDGCSSLKSINLKNFNTSYVRSMEYMFSNCSSLKKIDVSTFDTAFVVNMGHMFENCSSLTSIDLSTFNTTITQNTEFMFANDIKLVYANMENFEDSNIKNKNNMFQGTLENMVFCFNQSKTSIFNDVVKKKLCTAIDCSDNWIKSRRKTFFQKKTCLDECPEGFKFEDDYSCSFRCPDGSFPENFVCKKINEEKDDNDTCSIRRYFRNECKQNLNNPKLKQKFIEKVGSDLLSGNLYDLVIDALEKDKTFIIREEDIIYQIYALSNKIRVKDLVYIDMEECGKILRQKYQLNQKDEIIVFKIEYTSSDFRIPIVEYNLFGHFGTERLSLTTCNNKKFYYYIPKEIEDYEDYKYNPGNEYYNNECTTLTSKNNTDIIVKDRMNEFNINNMSLCEEMCIFKGYVNGNVECECKEKMKFNSFLNFNASKYNLIYRFKINKKVSSNFWVLKCYLLIFSKEVITSNICSQILLGIIVLTLIGALIFRLKGKKILYDKIKILITMLSKKGKNKNENNQQIKKNANTKINKKVINNTGNNKTINNNNNKKKIIFIGDFNKNIPGLIEPSSNRGLNFINSNNYGIRRRIIKNNTRPSIFNRFKTTNNKKNNKNKSNINEKNKNIMEITDNELNSLSYNDAIEKDNRTLCQFYFSLIRTKQLLVFTFNCKNDLNSKMIKINFLFLIISFIFFVNTAFLDERILHDIYITGGELGIMYNIPNFAYITLISLVTKNILMELVFTEGNIIPIKYAEPYQKAEIMKDALTCVALKCTLFYTLSILTMSFIWFYIACFFTVFKNTQIYAIRNSLITLCAVSLIPFGFYIFPATFRILALESKEQKNRFGLYIFSKIIQFLL